MKNLRIVVKPHPTFPGVYCWSLVFGKRVVRRGQRRGKQAAGADARWALYCWERKREKVKN